MLLIEDSRPTAPGLQQRLEGEGWEVEVAGGPTEGDPRARSLVHDVILLNLKTAWETGLDLVRGLRDSGVETPVLALVPPGGVTERVRALEHGADDCLTWPFEFDELTARLRALARRGGRRTEGVLRVRDLEIDTVLRTARRAGRLISLTPREFELLELLAVHRGRVVTRSMVWDRLYPDRADRASNVVDVYIRSLRAKIDKGFHPHLILTRWGEGYFLRDEGL